jgi:predicted transcriptional regulator
MARKKYVRRTKANGGYLYHATLTEESAGRNLLDDIVHRVFDGSTLAVVQRLLETTDLDADELNRIRQLIQRKQKEQS